MKNVEQLMKWRTELVELRNGFRKLIDAQDRSDVEEELQTCIESLEHNGYGPVGPHSFRRSVDLIAHCCYLLPEEIGSVS